MVLLIIIFYLLEDGCIHILRGPFAVTTILESELKRVYGMAFGQGLTCARDGRAFLQIQGLVPPRLHVDLRRACSVAPAGLQAQMRLVRATMRTSTTQCAALRNTFLGPAAERILREQGALAAGHFLMKVLHHSALQLK